MNETRRLTSPHLGQPGIPPPRTTLQFAPPAPRFWRHGSLSRAPNAARVHSSVRPSCNDVCQWSCASPYAPTPKVHGFTAGADVQGGTNRRPERWAWADGFMTGSLRFQTNARRRTAKSDIERGSNALRHTYSVQRKQDLASNLDSPPAMVQQNDRIAEVREGAIAGHMRYAFRAQRMCHEAT